MNLQLVFVTLLTSLVTDSQTVVGQVPSYLIDCHVATHVPSEEVLCLARSDSETQVGPGTCSQAECPMSLVAKRFAKSSNRESFVRFVVTAPSSEDTWNSDPWNAVTWIELYVTQERIHDLKGNLTSINFARGIFYPNNTIELYSIISELDPERPGYTKDKFLPLETNSLTRMIPHRRLCTHSKLSSQLVVDIIYSSFLWKDNIKFAFNKPASVSVILYHQHISSRGYQTFLVKEPLSTDREFLLLTDTRIGSTSMPNITGIYVKAPNNRELYSNTTTTTTTHSTSSSRRSNDPRYWYTIILMVAVFLASLLVSLMCLLIASAYHKERNEKYEQEEKDSKQDTNDLSTIQQEIVERRKVDKTLTNTSDLTKTVALPIKTF